MSRGPTKRRPYRMQQRAERMDETRLRITEAAMRLHTSVGPSAASLVGIAEEAGVTRATLYRYFSNAEELYFACMGHWIGINPPPDVGAWMAVADFEDRVRKAVTEMYAWYQKNDGDLFPLYRDTAFTPAAYQVERSTIPKRMAGALLTGVEVPADGLDRLRAALTHLMDYPTWRSLTAGAGLSTGQAAELAVNFVLSLVPHEPTH